jgi:flagellar biosynthesis protein FlhF
MRLKLYTAAGMPQAMAQIRAELGPDAVILGSRRIAGGVEVTAARDAAEAPPPPPQHAPPRRAPCPLAAHGTPEALAAKLRAGPLPFALSVVLRFQPLDAAALARPVLFLGPPGAGKTLTVARLATRLVLARARPRVATADTRRAGAFEQLSAYTDLLGIALRRFGEPGDAGGTPLLIDTPGLDPFDPGDRDEIAALVQASGALPVLVLPGGLDAGEAEDLAAGFADCGARRLVATRLDVARRLGGILAAAATLPLAEAGIGPAAPDGLVPMTPDLLAARLQRGAANRRPA